MALLLNANDSVSRTYIITKPSPTHPIMPQGTGERTAQLWDGDVPRYVYAKDYKKYNPDNAIALKAGTYTISSDGKLPIIQVFDENHTQLNVDGEITHTSGYYRLWDGLAIGPQSNALRIITVTLLSDCILTFAISDNLGTYIMLNTGSTAKPYEPYGYKIPISSAGQTTNIYLGDVETTRKIKKLVLTGNESGAMMVDNTNHIFALRGIFNSEPELLQVGGVCTHYKYNNAVSSLAANMQNGDFVLNKIVDDYSFTIKDNSFNTAPNFLTYLQQQYTNGTPVTVWYVLATPETAVVNEPIRKIGDYADEVSGISIPTIAGANTISVDTTLQPSEVTVNYKGWHPVQSVHERENGEWDGSPPPTYPVYGFKIDKNNDDPDTRVTYLYDAEGMTPAYMDFSNGTFNYGSWANAWFIKNNRPVALKFDGTVDYELNHTDFTKKLDGTASDVEDSSYNGNFMSQIPTVYVKRWEDNDYNYMAFCEIPYDEDFLAQAHTNANGTVNSAIYLPMFKGSVDSNNKMRSLMGTYPTGNMPTTMEVTYSANCGTGWQIWDKAKIDLIMDLIILITKSTNCRAKIGNGDAQTYNASDTTNYGKMKSGYETDSTTRSANAQFWGYEGTEVTNYGKHHMIAFYIEDLWGNRWDKCLGFNVKNGVYKVKMVTPYTLDSDSSYETLTVMPPSSTEGWLKNISSANTYGDVPMELGASNTSGFANYFFKNSSSSVTSLAVFGGYCINGVKVGRYWNVYNNYNNAAWFMGCSPCFNKPS